MVHKTQHLGYFNKRLSVANGDEKIDLFFPDRLFKRSSPSNYLIRRLALH